MNESVDVVTNMCYNNKKGEHRSERMSSPEIGKPLYTGGTNSNAVTAAWSTLWTIGCIMVGFSSVCIEMMRKPKRQDALVSGNHNMLSSDDDCGGC